MSRSIVPTGMQQPAFRPPQRAGGASIATAAADAQAGDVSRGAPREGAAPQPATSLGNSVEVSLDRDSGKPIVRVMDRDGRLVRQIPTEEVLELRRALDRITGLLVDRKA